MIIFTDKQREQIKRLFNFYDFEECTSLNGQLLITFNINVTRFGDLQFGGVYEEFISQANTLRDLIFNFINYFNRETIVAIKYQSNWIMNNKISPELSKWFRAMKLRKNLSGAIGITEKEVLEEFIYSNLRYNSFTHFLLPNARVMFTVTDHMDLFITGMDLDKLFDVCNQIINTLEISEKVLVKVIK